MAKLYSQVRNNADGSKTFVTANKEYTLSAAELAANDHVSSQIRNDAVSGFNFDINNLAIASRMVIDSVRYTEDLTKFAPIIDGEQNWADQVLYFKTAIVARDYKGRGYRAGQMSNMARTPKSEVSVRKQIASVYDFWDMAEWTLPELKQAEQAGGILDLAQAKLRAIAEIYKWEVFFEDFWNGIDDGVGYGLKNNPNVRADSTIMTEPFSEMAAADFKAKLKEMIDFAYTVGKYNTIKYNRLFLPTDDWGALGLQIDETQNFRDAGVGNRIQHVLDWAFQTGFEMYPSAMLNADNNGGTSKYILAAHDPYNYHVKRTLPLMFVPGVPNGMRMSTEAYARHTTPILLRNESLVYFNAVGF